MPAPPGRHSSADSSSSSSVDSSTVAKAVAGMGAGVLSAIMCSPLDVAKTRVQVQTSLGDAKYRGVFGALATIYADEGLAGWFRGIAPAMCSVAVFWSVYFPCYDRAKEQIAQASGLPKTSSVVHCSAAAAAGGLTDVITNPLWVVRTRMATSPLRSAGSSGTDEYASMASTIRSIARDEGLAAFWKGLSASLLGLSHIMIQFPLYERLKVDLAGPRAVADGGGGGGGGGSSSSGSSRMGSIVAASAISKLIASTISYPHEVVRSRLQFDKGTQMYDGMLDAVRKTYRADGLAGFWQGYTLNLTRTIPQCVITFVAYEWLSEQLQARLRPVGELDGGGMLARTRSDAH